MEIGSSISPLAGYPLPVSKSPDPASAYVRTETDISPVRKASDVLSAEALAYHRQAYLGRSQDDYPDQRTRRAITAYAALQQNQQRDYLSQVLGVDEYV